jgi:hypothetical protein
MQFCPNRLQKETKQADGDTPGSNGNLSAMSSGLADLRREKRERLENERHENKAKGRKVIRVTDISSTVLGKEEMAVRL